jgi:galactokinase
VTGRSVTWSAPGRVNLIGDHTDYADGLVLPFAVPMRTVVSASARDDGVLRVTSDSVTDPYEAPLASVPPADGPARWAAYVHGAARLVRDRGLPLTGADLMVTGGVPLGAGLSSSAALATASLAALVDLVGIRWSTDDLALAARAVENEYVGAPVGVMDPWVVTHARAGHALLLDTRTLHEEQVALALVRPGGSDPGTLALLVVDSGTPHRTTGHTYAERVAQVRRAAADLGLDSLRDADDAALSLLPDPVLRARARHVVSENRRVRETVALLREGDVRGIGPLLTASHASLRDDYEVSTAELDLIVTAALEAGALGARLTGAGEGGCALALVEQERSSAVRTAVERELRAVLGRNPRSWWVVPSPGAAREPQRDDRLPPGRPGGRPGRLGA